jgi:hypothetical protein
MKRVVEMGYGAIIHLPNFINIGLGSHNLLKGLQTHKEQGDLISICLFFQNRERRAKNKNT